MRSATPPIAIPIYRSLQISRGIAAMLVVLFHLGGSFASERYFGLLAFDAPFSWADAGVDFFFVLSGFIVTAMHRRDFGQPSRLMAYLHKRAVRIYPTYWFVCLLVALAALALPSLRPAIESETAVALRSLLLIPQDPAQVGGTGSTILFVAWSLQYELLFYGLIGLFIVHRGLGLAAVALLLANMLSCDLSAQCGFARGFVASPFMLLFAMGAACAWATHGGWRLPRPRLAALLGSLGFFGFGVFEVFAGRADASVRPLVYGLFASLTLTGLVQAEQDRTLQPRQRLLEAIGDASYSLYLLHIPVISIGCKLLMAARVEHPVLLVAGHLGVFAASVLVALAAYRFVERPMLRRLQHDAPTAPSALPRRAMQRAPLR